MLATFLGVCYFHKSMIPQTVNPSTTFFGKGEFENGSNQPGMVATVRLNLKGQLGVTK
jgi:hypothetical protein